MTRGNQRELARAKNLKKQDKKGPKEDGLTVEQRRLRDAEALREKQKKKAETGEATTGSSKSSG